METPRKPLVFTVPVPQQFSLAQLEPAPTPSEIDAAFTQYPWCAELGIAAENRVMTRAQWKADKISRQRHTPDPSVVTP